MSLDRAREFAQRMRGRPYVPGFAQGGQMPDTTEFQRRILQRLNQSRIQEVISGERDGDDWR